MNLRELLDTSADRFGDRVAIRFKRGGEWHVRTYRALRERARVAAEALFADGVRSGARVGLFRENAPDWPEAYFGIVALGAAAVPIDPRLREQEVAHILRDAGVETVLCGARQYALLRDIEDRIPDLRKVRTLDDPPPAAGGGRAHYAAFADGLAAAEAAAVGASPAWERAAIADTAPASLIYTSGTTGRAKGAILSHGNFTANARSCVEAIQVRPDDNFLLALPLHHAFAFTANLVLPLMAGAEISFVESLKTVGENLREVSPTVLLAVPLLLDKLYRRIHGGVREKPLARILLAAGVLGPIRRAVRAKIGGRLRLAVSGGAPCDPELLRGLARLGIPAVEGYGLTEAGPVVTINPPEAPRPGTVGRALPGVEIRLIGADAAGVGELAVRGPNIMAGYYRNPAATREVLREDGWLSTGDLASIDADGYVTIRGRIKALIVNREGKNIYPEEVEQQLARSPYVLEALVVGYHDPDDPTGERVGAIIVPNIEAIDARAPRHGTLSDPEVERLIRDDVQRVLGEIADYKRPRRIQIRAEEFEKTSTAKVKRYLYDL